MLELFVNTVRTYLLFQAIELSDIVVGDDSLEVGTTERNGFIVDNVFHSRNQGDIHFTSYYPENYDATKDYAIYFALPGWEGFTSKVLEQICKSPFLLKHKNIIVIW